MINIVDTRGQSKWPDGVVRAASLEGAVRDKTGRSGPYLLT